MAAKRVQARSETIPVRFTPDDVRAIERAAEKHGMTVAAFIRSATLMTMVMQMDTHAMSTLLQAAVVAARKFMEAPPGKVTKLQPR